MPKVILLLVLVSLLSGCISLNNRASLINQSNISQSINDLTNQSQKFINDDFILAKIKFIYSQSQPDKIKKISVHFDTTNPKQIFHLSFDNQAITNLKQETHYKNESNTDVKNHTFLVENNQIKSVLLQNSKYLDETHPDFLTTIDEASKLLEYILTTYLAAD